MTQNNISEFIDALKVPDSFVIYYQPKVNSEGYIKGAEALVRWKRNNELIYPSDFLWMVEKEDKMNILCQIVIQEVCSVLKNIPLFPISINVSPKQLTSTNFMERLIDTLQVNNTPFESIELELLESCLMETKDPVYAMNIIEILMLLASHSGIRLAMDDFGKGHSCMCRLSDLPIHILKLDKSFVYMLDNKKSIVIKHIINMAHDLGMSVVAEGVETSEQADFYWNQKVDLIQGYFYYHPVPKEEFIQLIKNQGV